MTKHIEFYFDFISPYTYLGHKRIENEGSGINFNYKPILLGGLHKLWNITPQAYIEPKMEFMIMDCKMVSKILNQIDIKLEEFIDKIEKNDVKEKLKKFTSDAFKKKIFGAPTFVINNKNFWGQDRFEYAIEEFNSIS